VWAEGRKELEMLYYKIIKDNWEIDWDERYLPHQSNGAWTPGEWTPAKIQGVVGNDYFGYLVFHADLISWCGDGEGELYEVEAKGIKWFGNKRLASTVRLLRRIDGWKPETMKAFTCDLIRRRIWYALPDVGKLLVKAVERREGVVDARHVAASAMLNASQLDALAISSAIAAADGDTTRATIAALLVGDATKVPETLREEGLKLIKFLEGEALYVG